MCHYAAMLLVASMSGIPAVGVGAMGRPDEEILAIARRFVRQAGSSEPVLLALATGRVVSRDLRIPRLNASPRFILTPTRWWIADRQGNASYARGAVKNIVGAFTTSDGVTVALSESKSARFVLGATNADRAKSLIETMLAHARLCTSGFETIAPTQQPLMLVGTHVGGYGTDLRPGEECAVAVSGRGICATGTGSVLLKPADRVRAILLGGVGVTVPDLLNLLAARRHLDCFVRFVFDDAEAAFSLTSDTPQRLHQDISPLSAALRSPSVPPSPEAPQPVPTARSEAAPTGWTAPAAAPAAASAGGFCGFCGTAKTPSHAYCTKCGKLYQA